MSKRLPAPNDTYRNRTTPAQLQAPDMRISEKARVATGKLSREARRIRRDQVPLYTGTWTYPHDVKHSPLQMTNSRHSRSMGLRKLNGFELKSRGRRQGPPMVRWRDMTREQRADRRFAHGFEKPRGRHPAYAILDEAQTMTDDQLRAAAPWSDPASDPAGDMRAMMRRDRLGYTHQED